MSKQTRASIVHFLDSKCSNVDPRLLVLIAVLRLVFGAEVARSDLIVPEEYSSPLPIEQVHEPSLVQAVEVILQSTLPAQYEEETDFGNGWRVDVIGLNFDGEKYDRIGLRAYSTVNAYYEMRMTIEDAGAENGAYHVAVPRFLVEPEWGWGPHVEINNNSEVDEGLELVSGIALYGTDGTPIYGMPLLPRNLHFDTLNETVPRGDPWNEYDRTMDGVNQINGQIAGWETAPRVVGVDLLAMIVHSGEIPAPEDYNHCDIIWRHNVGDMYGTAGNFTLDAPCTILLNRLLAGIEAVLNELDSMVRIDSADRPDGDYRDEEKIVYRIADAAIRNTDQGRLIIRGYFPPNFDDNDGDYPANLPDYAIASFEFDGINNGCASGQIGGATDVPNQIGATARLDHNYPNPFNPSTTISFTVPQATTVSLRVYDLSGRLIRSLLSDESIEQGRHEVIWNGLDERGGSVSSGVYFYRLESGGFSETKRMSLVR